MPTRIITTSIALGGLLGLVAGLSTEFGHAADAPSIQRWTIGGEGGWDYLTVDAAHRLFIARATRVDVVDTTSGRVIGSIADTQGVHGVALAPDLHRGFTSNGKADSITVFDLDTLETLREVKIPAHNPDAILYDAQDKRLFTFDGKSKDVTVIDTSTLAVIATLPVPDKPEFAVDDHVGRIFVNIESDPGQMVVIDSRALAIKATWQLPGCNSPSGLAMDRLHRRLFSVCDDKVMAITDADTGRQIARLPIGDGPDGAVFDEERRLAMSSNGDGTLTVVREESPDRFHIVDTIDTQRGARTMALDPATGRIFLVTADFGPAPPASPGRPHPRGAPLPGTFVVLAVDLPSGSIE